MLQEPENTGVSDDSGAQTNTCDKVPGRADGPHQIQNGYGFDDGPYKHASTKMDNAYPNNWTWTYDSDEDVAPFYRNLQWAQVVNLQNIGDPRAAVDDEVIYDKKSGVWTITVWSNRVDGNDKMHEYSVPAPFDCFSNDVRWADVSFSTIGPIWDFANGWL
jgi:hypothetical protein